MIERSALKHRMASVMFVTEERGWWAKGRLRRDETVIVEMCFDNPRLDDLPMSDEIPLVYLGIMSRDQFRFEFQNGFVAVQPVDSQTHQDVMMIAMHVAGYRHQPAPIPRKVSEIGQSDDDQPKPLKRHRQKFYRVPAKLRNRR